MFLRIRAVVEKEFSQTLRDRRALAIQIGLPIVRLIIFPYAIRMNVEHIPTVVADQSLDASSHNYIAAMTASGYFDVVDYVAGVRQAIRLIDEGRAQAGIIIPPGLATHTESHDAQVLLILDGSDSFSVQSGYSAAVAIARTHALSLLSAQVEQLGGTLETVPIRASSRDLYNPNLEIDLRYARTGCRAAADPGHANSPPGVGGRQAHPQRRARRA